MAKLLRSNIPSKSESKNRIAFASPNIPRFTQPLYLQSKHNHLESEIPIWSNNCNQKRFQKKNQLNAQQNDKKLMQLLSQKKIMITYASLVLYMKKVLHTN